MIRVGFGGNGILIHWRDAVGLGNCKAILPAPPPAPPRRISGSEATGAAVLNINAAATGSITDSTAGRRCLVSQARMTHRMTAMTVVLWAVTVTVTVCCGRVL